ncbi:glycosyltransferase family 4 protein [Rhodobacterales bacterium]|nr:glycosyltransferase family 4 protein [Rhodobacterales bacterium]
MRGGEKVLEAFCDLFPDADIFTHVHDPDLGSDIIRAHTVKTSFINGLPFARKAYPRYLPLMPLALEQLDLRGYDLIISSESGPAKGIIPDSNALHLCYCHSPMRYLWNMYQSYYERSGVLTRLLMPPLSHYLRAWDVTTAQRVDKFAANSATVANRIQRYYHRPSDVIHPPVDTQSFQPVDAADVSDYYLMVGELVRYKRPDLAVEAFNRMKAKLVVIGQGEMLSELKKMAGPTVEILGSQPFEALQHHYARCKALIFPGEEDFGIVPLEAMASGRPVIAYGKGGATETVVPGKTGVFFDRQTVDSLTDAVHRLKEMPFDPDDAVARAAEFSREIFKARLKAFVDDALAEAGML